ncbi:hypothetical protein Dcae01_02740 [Deinococcus caeni]|uniref:Uncharacterized protein n=1 Tax=Deinococcus caeni TaxID=569127 RepID=A0ABP9UFL0_9DEIO
MSIPPPSAAGWVVPFYDFQERLIGCYTDSVCFANNPEPHRIAGSKSGTRFPPTRIRSD